MNLNHFVTMIIKNMKTLSNLILVMTVLILSGCAGKNSVQKLKDNMGIGKSYGVDLGLSVNWAECNVGAESPEQIGYRTPLGNVTGTTKAPATRHSNISGTDSDIAKVKMGDGWRMPTGPEMKELLEKCTWTPDTLNGSNGFRVTGPNGNSIFLPDTGPNYSFEELASQDIFYDFPIRDSREGNYWCGTPVEDYYNCNHINFDSKRQRVELMLCEPYFLSAIRAVHD